MSAKSILIRFESGVVALSSRLPLLTALFILATANPSLASVKDFDGISWIANEQTYHVLVDTSPDSDAIELSLLVEKDGTLQRRIHHLRTRDRARAEQVVDSWLEKHGYDPESAQADAPAESQGDSIPPAHDRDARFVTEDRTQAVWKSTREWDASWEEQYAVWLKKNLQPNYFIKYGIATDCADVTIGLRWIFARENGLPAANTLAGSGALFSNESFLREWANLKRGELWYQDQVFLAALDYLMQNTYTRSLIYDGYPIRIKIDDFNLGVFHLDLRESGGGHTMMVVQIGSGGSSLWMLQSTLPRAVRKLFYSEYQRKELPQLGMGGFLKMRWPRKVGGTWVLLKGSRHADFSLEQFANEFTDGNMPFSVAVKQRLNAKFDIYNDFQSGIKQVFELINKRIVAVQSGYLACQSIDCSPESPGWHEYSSPVRDGTLKDILNLVNQLATENSARDTRVGKLWKKTLRSEFKIDGARVPFEQILLAFLSGKTSPDPRLEPALRWGLK